MTREATACPACHAGVPDGARFCPACGTLLLTGSMGVTERRIVTTLFVDVVGFTEISERLDPEDVHASLLAFYEIARTTIERFGGVVEKFIGDAVVGVFGVPILHEDDAERGVRAGLDIVSRLSSVSPGAGAPLQVRAGVNTGPALARLDVLASSGEGMLVGDAVNVAARLLGAAEPGAVVVGEATRRLSAKAILYEALPALSLKGKAEPVQAWRALGPIARRGINGDGSFTTPAVGREVELGILNGLMEKTVASSVPHLVLVVGEAGIGKSRLLQEFFRILDERTGFLCRWRQGRCPPYGEGLAFWPLREIVSGHAGIGPDDTPEAAEEKLRQTFVEEADRDWLVNRLRPLVGLSGQQSGREENFAAWVRLFEAIAKRRPAVVVLEDLHWASEETVAFLTYLLRNAASVPLLVIATARPEFLDRWDDEAPEVGRFTRLDVAALSREESVRLASGLLDVSARSGTAELVADRCGGNPLFAEELVRFESSRPDGEAAPDSIRVLLAARLDALPAAHKALLADASVVGQVFSADAVAALSDRSVASVDAALGDLMAREFVRPRHEASAGSRREYSFWHALMRDVAYEQLTRTARAHQHAMIGRWLEEAGGPRDEVSDMLAYHYSTALDLARVSGERSLASGLRAPAVSALWAAGEHALALDVMTAERYLRRAVAESAAEDGGRAGLLISWAEALTQSGHLPQARLAYEEGIAAYRAAGEPRPAAVAMMRLASALYWQDGRVATRLREEATGLLEGEGDCPELARVLEECAVLYSRDFESEHAIAAANAALQLSADFGLPLPTRALSYRGCSRVDLGDKAGLADLGTALRFARHHGLGLDADIAAHLLADALFPFHGPRASLKARRDGLRYAVGRGNRLSTLWFEEGCVHDLFHCGRWDEAEEHLATLEPRVEKEGVALDLLDLRAPKTLILLARGRLDLAAPLAEWCAAQARDNAGLMFTMNTILAAVRCRQGSEEEALELLREVESASRSRRGAQSLALVLTLAIRTALAAGDERLAQRFLDEAAPGRPFETHARATLGALVGERGEAWEEAARLSAQAATGWQRFGAPWEEALAHAGHGRCLLRLGRPGDAGRPLSRARQIFSRLGARDELASLPA